MADLKAGKVVMPHTPTLALLQNTCEKESLLYLCCGDQGLAFAQVCAVGVLVGDIGVDGVRSGVTSAANHSTAQCDDGWAGKRRACCSTLGLHVRILYVTVRHAVHKRCSWYARYLCALRRETYAAQCKHCQKWHCPVEHFPYYGGVRHAEASAVQYFRWLVPPGGLAPTWGHGSQLCFLTLAL